LIKHQVRRALFWTASRQQDTGDKQHQWKTTKKFHLGFNPNPSASALYQLKQMETQNENTH